MNLNSESDYNPLTTPTSERSSLFSQALPTNYSDMSDTEEDRQRVEMRMKVLYSMFHQILTVVSISVHSQTVHYKSFFKILFLHTLHMYIPLSVFGCSLYFSYFFSPPSPAVGRVYWTA